MRARPTRFYAWMMVGLLGSPLAFADEPKREVAPSKVSRPKAVDLPPAPQVAPPALETPAQPAATALATEADAKREELALDVRRKALEVPEEKEKPSNKPIIEALAQRKVLLDTWKKAHADRLDAETPKRSPEIEAAEYRVDLEKTQALLDQAGKTPDALLPEVFRINESDAKVTEARLAEMKDAIDAARAEQKELTSKLETLRADGTRNLSAEITALRSKRDKVFQSLAGLSARRNERQAGIAAATSAEAREVANEKLINFDWESRIEAENFAAAEVRIVQATKRLDLAAVPIQVKSAHVQLAKKLAERMEARYAALAERQRIDLKREVAKEETRAAASSDPVERRRAQRSAQLLELESQVVAFEKAYATQTGVSLQEQTSLADKAVTEFAELKKLVDDGTVTQLDALRLKNDFRRIGPERSTVVRTDLAAAEAELTTYSNALADVEIELVNDSRDDRFDRESLLEQVPAKRRGEAALMLEALENRHKTLLNHKRDVLQKLARRAEDTHSYVLKRINTLDEQYAFIRTHIFWIKDAEPLGATTVAHARDDAVRTAKAVGALTLEFGDRSLWGRFSPLFGLTLLALVALPYPLLLGQKALERLRLPSSPDSALSLADYQDKLPKS